MRGVDAGALVTRVSFDTDSSVPKLMFKAARFITEEEMHAVSDLVQSEEVINLKQVSMATLDASHEDPTGGDEEAPAPAPTPAPTAQKPAQQATQRPAATQQRPAPQATQRPVQTQQATQRPAATQQRPTQTIVQDGVPVSTRTTTQRPAPTPAPAPEPEVQEVGSDDELSDLLASLE